MTNAPHQITQDPTQEYWIAPDWIYDGIGLRRGAALAITGRKSGNIAARADLPEPARVLAIQGTLCAGFLDLQVNGGGDVLLNNDPTGAGMTHIAAAHRRFGTVGILPTLISDRAEVMTRAVEAALSVHKERGILGLHLEGPHLSQARRGTHSPDHIRPFERETLAHIERLRAAGIFVKITLAPEAVSPAQVAQIVATGAVVSIGHSDADSAAVGALLAAGASCFTHLLNAMSPMQGRAAGVTGACLNSQAYAGIICDGHHVADEMIALAIRARPVAGRMFMVSDAMPTVGGGDHFSLYGQKLHLENGRLVNREGALAGAHITMAQGLARLITKLGLNPEQALDMAIAAPARLLGQPALASPAQRDLDDLLILDRQWTAHFLNTHLTSGE